VSKANGASWRQERPNPRTPLCLAAVWAHSLSLQPPAWPRRVCGPPPIMSRYP